MSKENKKGNGSKDVIIAFTLGIFVLFSFHLLINRTNITGLVSYKESSVCSCRGTRFVDLFSDYSFTDGESYIVTANVYKGSGTSQLIDSETVNFSSLPQYSIDDNPGDSLKGNLIIEKINKSGILIKFHNKTKENLLADNTFQIIINSIILGPDTIHLSCPEICGEIRE